MKAKKISMMLAMIFLISFSFTSCTHDDAPECTDPGTDPGVGESPDVLLVKKFSTTPNFDGEIDDVWKEARPLVNKATVSKAGDRIIPLNGSSNGDASLEPTDLMDPYTGESYNYSLRGGHDGEYLYLLFEWEDEADSRDRQSWYFDGVSSTWKQENKYANHKNDKFYEDKFAMMFPIKVNGAYPDGFEGGTCTVTCHSGLTDPQPGHKTTRHYMKNIGELADLWHWKRDRNELSQSVDDGYVRDADGKEGSAAANGRKADEGKAPYSTSMKFTDPDTELSGPKYVIPNRTNYYWITQAEIDNNTAIAVTAISEDGVLKLENDTFIDPNGDVEYSQGFGNKRMPSVIINPGEDDFRRDTQVRAKHNGSGWQVEIKRKLNSGDPNDAVFVIGEEMPFGLVIFNNAAIGHAQSNFLTMKIEK